MREPGSLPADVTLSPAETASILAERARRLAAPRAPAKSGALLELIAFGLANERYAIETRYVVDLLRGAETALLPGVEPPLLGIVAWRGELLPLLDLPRILGLSPEGAASSTHLVILGDDRPAFVVQVDAPLDLHDLPRSDVRPMVGARDGRHLFQGVTTDALLVLDAADLIRTYSAGAPS
jgi:purine-binding chemotaxis protein CheW